MVWVGICSSCSWRTPAKTIAGLLGGSTAPKGPPLAQAQPQQPQQPVHPKQPVQPQQPVQPEQPDQEWEKRVSTAITIIDRQVRCKSHPDNLVASNSLTRIYNPGKAATATCWAPNSFAKGAQNAPFWLKTQDGCFIDVNQQTGGERTKDVLEKCQNIPPHLVGVLKLDQQPYCYDEPTLDSASHRQIPTTEQARLATNPGTTGRVGSMYLDLECRIDGVAPAVDLNDR